MDRKRILISVLLALVLSAAVATAQDDDRVMHLRRAESLERAGELDRALALLEAILSDSPAEERALLAVERINRRLRRGERTLEVVERARAAAPRAQAPRQIELRVLAELGRTEDVMRAGLDWIQADPGSELPYLELSGILLRSGAVQEAERILRSGLDAVADPTRLRLDLADLYVQTERWNDAAEEWTLMTKRSPGLAWDLIAFKLRRLGSRAEPAADALVDALDSMGSRDPELRRLTALAALYAGREGMARRTAQDVVGELSEAERHEFVSELARVGSRSRPDVVAWTYRLLLPYTADDSVRWQLTREIVRYDLSAGDTSAALEMLGDALTGSGRQAASHRWASAWQIRLLAAGGQAERAGQTLQRYLAAYPDDAEIPELALTVAGSNLRDGRLEAAEAALAAVDTESASDRLAGRLAVTRGYLALYAGRYDEAMAQLEAAVVSLEAAERAEALRILGFLREANNGELSAVAAAHRTRLQGRLPAAHDEIVHGLRKVPDSPARPGLLLWAGELAAEAADLDRAEPTLRRVYSEHAETAEAPIALMALAETLGREPGRRGEAIEILESLILEYPDSAVTPIARRRLAELRRQVPHS